MPKRRRWTVGAPAFLAGALAGSALTWSLLNAPARLQALADDCGDASDAQVETQPAGADEIAPARSSRPVEVERLGPDPIAALRERALTLPVKGIDASDLRSSFDEQRSEGRRHEAIDILSPRNTPVLAVEDGTIARLFTSKAGGLTIYQFDPGSNYAYYYAHLESYAVGLKDRDRVKRGQVLGYVGTSGNAPKDTPHLHFAIFKLMDQKQWWKGTAIDPYTVLR